MSSLLGCPQKFLGVDYLIPIGGDGTLSCGVRLHEEGVTVIAVPKTMDNDVPGIDYCIGFNKSRRINDINQRLSYLVRCGNPDAIDSIVPIASGNLALDLILQRAFGRMGGIAEQSG